MKNFSRITIIIGTRPEAIKLAPVVKKLKSYKFIKSRVVLTGQHKEMVDQVMSIFELSCDVNLETMNKSNGVKCISSNGGATNAMYFAFSYHTNA